jgi:hypothetical protein
MNFFDYVKLIELGHFPAPPNGDWLAIREAIVNLEKVARACQLTGENREADRLKQYVERMDKESGHVSPVE